MRTIYILATVAALIWWFVWGNWLAVFGLACIGIGYLMRGPVKP